MIALRISATVCRIFSCSPDTASPRQALGSSAVSPFAFRRFLKTESYSLKPHLYHDLKFLDVMLCHTLIYVNSSELGYGLDLDLGAFRKGSDLKT